MRRFVTVSSGKGGVGKTTFAINFALTLARTAPTVLVDLDTGTSSVRNTLDVEVDRDLYHFFRHDTPLAACITRLDGRLDPGGRFRHFGFIAAPRHAIEEITNLSDSARRRLQAALNDLPATFVVLDLRAGLDPNVLDFLPVSNSGVLVFTPHHPAATLAAADIVKSLLFRKLRMLFAPGSPVFRASTDAYSDHRLVNDLLDQVEDVYEEKLPNLDAFLRDLLEALGDNRYIRAIADVVHSFGVYFVLNMFNGVEESFDDAVRPFVETLTTHVSSRLHLTNLGWIVQDERIHRANCERRPILLNPPETRLERVVDPVQRELAELESSLLGLPVSRDATGVRPIRDEVLDVDPLAPLERQLEILRAMYRSPGSRQVQHNFSYIAHRALHVMRAMPPDLFGQPRLRSPADMMESLDPDLRSR
jgi:MinD-like ATPase involved in chromosome partitioning or flagellar assembly